MRRSTAIAALALTITTQAAAQAHPWGHRNADPERTCQSTFAGPVNGDVFWSYTLSGVAPGLVVNRNGDIATGTIFNNAWWSQGVAATVYQANGNIMFRRNQNPYPWGYSQGVKASPAWGPDNSLVLASTNGELLKYAPTGATQWKLKFRNDAPNDFSPVVMPDNSVRHLKEGLNIISPTGTILSTGTGSKELSVNTANGEMATGAYRATSSATRQYTAIIYLNADGTMRWNKKVYKGGGSMPVIGSDGTVYAGIGSGQTFAYTPQGDVKWSALAGGYDCLYGLGKNGTLYVADGYSLRALNATNGSLKWTLSGIGKSIGNIAIDVNDKIYLGNSVGELRCVNPDGTIVWNRQICTQFTTGPAIGINNTLVIAGKQEFENWLFSIR